MWRLVPALLAVGCNHDVARDAVVVPTQIAAAAGTSPSVQGAPHAGSIREVSVTDEGDAALTIDDAGTVRLWPTLDGTREPIPVIVPATAQGALVRDGDGWLAGLLDDAGSAHLLRFARGGVQTARTEVPGDVRIEQIVASRGQLLVRRADQSIELVDASGAIAGRIVAAPGEQIAMVAARGDVALAVIAGVDGTTKTVRWIARERGIAWGARVALPSAVAANSVAVAASGKRIAGAEAKSRQLFVFDLRAKPAVVVGTSVQVQADEPLGFIDDAHVVAMGAQPRWWSDAAEHSDPWANTTPPNPATSQGAVGGGRLVSGYGGGLALATPTKTKYLGWHDIGVQSSAFVDGRIAVTFGPAHVAWLDGALVEQRRAELTSTATFTQPVGDHHVVYEWQINNDLHVELVDLDRPKDPVALGSFKSITRMDYEPRTHVLGVGEGAAEHLWALDLATTTAKRLPDLAVPADAQYVRLLDPAIAGGTRAVVSVNTDTHSEVTRLPGGKRRPLPGYVLAVDDQGRTYSDDNTPTMFRDDAVLEKDASGDVPTPDHAGRLVAMVRSDGVRLLDGGVERWKLPLWGVMTAAFSDDDTQLLVRTVGGMTIVDVATGERSATACAWGFGLYDAATSPSPVGQGSVCEDSER